MSGFRAMRLGILALAGVISARVALAQVGAVVGNWPVPGVAGARDGSGLTTQGEISQGAPFVALAPCRLVDTRGASGPFGGPALVAGSPRNFVIPSGPCTGLSTFAVAYSLNITVVNALGPGFIKVFPEGGPSPGVSTLNYVAGQTVANAAIVPAGTGGGITVAAGVSGTNLLIDINGYFTGSLAPGNLFVVLSNYSGVNGVISGVNFDTSAASHAGKFEASTAVNGGSGLEAFALGNSGYVFGVKGLTESPAFDSAGVKGVGGFGDPLGDATDCTPCQAAGVRGVNLGGWGVLGVARNGAAGVRGTLLDPGDNSELHGGFLGTSSYGVFSNGDTGATGTKFFVDPHPTDASKVIRYVSLEGPEAGTFFRGTARTQGGVARIEVPESFRMVTDPDGLTTQLTPVGAFSQMYVVSQDLNQVVVRSSQDVTFHYMINGVRAGYKDFQPIKTGDEFAPEKPNARIPTYLNDAQKQRVIANGTYNADGTVNLETARRLGWTRNWEPRAAPRNSPDPDASGDPAPK